MTRIVPSNLLLPADNLLHLRRVVDPQGARIGAEQGDRRAVPGLVASFAEDPIDDRLLGPGRRGHPERVGCDVVLAPHLPLHAGG